MLKNSNKRMIPVIYVYSEGILIGTFINMNMVDKILPKNINFNFIFSHINESNNKFNKLLRKGYVMNNSKFSKKQLEMLALNLKDSDAIVAYIMSFYEENKIKTEKELVKKLEIHKPLRRAIELQNQINK